MINGENIDIIMIEIMKVQFGTYNPQKYISDKNKKSTVFSALLNPELLHSIIENL